MTYEEAARILTRQSKTVNVPSLQVAIEMGADALFKRAAQEKSVSYETAVVYSEENPDGELIDIS